MHPFLRREKRERTKRRQSHVGGPVGSCTPVTLETLSGADAIRGCNNVSVRATPAATTTFPRSDHFSIAVGRLDYSLEAAAAATDRGTESGFSFGPLISARHPRVCKLRFTRGSDGTQSCPTPGWSGARVSVRWHRLCGWVHTNAVIALRIEQGPIARALSAYLFLFCPSTTNRYSQISLRCATVASM